MRKSRGSAAASSSCTLTRLFLRPQYGCYLMRDVRFTVLPIPERVPRGADDAMRRKQDAKLGAPVFSPEGEAKGIKRWA